MRKQKHCHKCRAVLQKILEDSGEYSVDSGDTLYYLRLKCPNSGFMRGHDNDYIRDHWYDEGFVVPKLKMTRTEWTEFLNGE